MVIGVCLCKSSHLLLPIFHGAPHLLAREQRFMVLPICWHVSSLSQCSPSAGK